jgi:hypothetical protein
MISEHDEMSELYVLGELLGKDLIDFENKLSKSPELAHEVELYKEIVNSVIEKDIMDLRSNLKVIFDGKVTNEPEQFFFDLAQNLNVNLTNDQPYDFSGSENTLQQIHIENHKRSLTERIHQINLQTTKDQDALLTKQIDDFSFWEEVKDAVLEKDVIEMRTIINDIISEGHISLSDYEIDEYLSNELLKEQVSEIENMISSSSKLADHVQLHREIDLAIHENDIIKLRNSLMSVIDNEQQIRSSEIKRIDDYLLGYLDENDKAAFVAKLALNAKLEEEVELNYDINSAIIEKDILNIRASLANIVNEPKDSKIRKFIPDSFKEKPLQFVGAAASIAAIISTGFLSLNNENMNAEKLFRQAYHPYEASGLFRSAAIETPAIIGVDLYNAHRYDEALTQFSMVLNENEEHPMSNFFTGLCFMEKNQFDKAIGSFQKVIAEKDNLFIEQAQWYIALSLLGSNNQKDAYQLLNQIVANNGYYRKNAKDLLKKLD